MKVLVLGAGVVGVTTAWYLAEAGHEVTVVEQEPGAGLKTSFANGGQISPCHAEPWANPATPMRALRWLGQEDAPLLFRWTRFDPALWAWGARFLLNCTAKRAEINTGRTLRVAAYSRACLQRLRRDIGIEYDQKTLGILHVYRDQRDFDGARKVSELMNRLGLERQIKTPAQAVEIEPALESVHRQLVGAVFTPGDESGDAHKFTCGLAALCAAKGVVFRFGTRVEELELSVSGRRLASVSTDKGRLHADAVVLCAASWSPPLARQLGLRLPIYPAKGYSATLTVADAARAPQVSITDDEHKMVYSRLGDRLRCAGTAELAGWDTSLDERRARLIPALAERLFPGAGDYSKAEPWCGLRPVTPDSVPILGATRVPGFYLNTGHGTLGWTMACGSAKLLADVVSGRPADIDISGLGLDRFGVFSA